MQLELDTQIYQEGGGWGGWALLLIHTIIWKDYWFACDQYAPLEPITGFREVQFMISLG